MQAHRCQLRTRQIRGMRLLTMISLRPARIPSSVSIRAKPSARSVDRDEEELASRAPRGRTTPPPWGLLVTQPTNPRYTASTGACKLQMLISLIRMASERRRRAALDRSRSASHSMALVPASDSPAQRVGRWRPRSSRDQDRDTDRNDWQEAVANR